MCSPKRISDSLTTHVEILMPADLNGYNRLFGGRLMQWIDVVAGVVARRHSGCEVTPPRWTSWSFRLRPL